MSTSATVSVGRIGATEVLRNPDLDPISDKQLKDFAPTIFAKSGIAGVSEMYGHVSSIAIVNALREVGLEPVEVRQSKRRDTERMPWTKHMIKFRPTGAIKKVQVNDVVPQVVMLNSHDRSSGFHLYAGLYRLICSNGMMVSDGAEVEPIRIHHTSRMVQDIIDRSKELIRCADGVFRLRSDMLATELSQREAMKFASNALTFRPKRTAVLAPEALLIPRRPEDDKNDLWHVFNRVQENMLRGGNETKTAEGRTVMTRGIGRIEKDVMVNTKLWSLAVQTIAKAAASSKKATASAAKKAAPKKASKAEEAPAAPATEIDI